MTLTELMDKPLTPRSFYIAPLCYKGDFIMLVGPQKSGKTWLAQDFSICAAFGNRLGGRFFAPNPITVAVVDAELPEVELKQRMDFVTSLYGKVDELFKSSVKMFCLKKTGEKNLLNYEDQEWLRRQLGDSQLVLLDNLGKLAPGADLSPSKWRTLEKYIRSLCSEGKSVILVHHTNNEGKMRGTGKISDDVDLVLQIEPSENSALPGGRAMVVNFDSPRYLHGEQLKPFTVEYATIDGRFVRQLSGTEDCKYAPESSLQDDELAEYGRTGLQSEMMVAVRAKGTIQAADFIRKKVWGRSRSTVSSALKGLCDLGLLEKQGVGKSTSYQEKLR